LAILAIVYLLGYVLLSYPLVEPNFLIPCANVKLVFSDKNQLWKV